MKLKGIDGTPHKRWIMLFNSKVPEKPHQVLTCFCKAVETQWRLSVAQVVHGCRQLVSWDVGLSPATSATLIVSYQHVMVGTLARLPVINWRKVGTTSNHHAPYDLGYKRDTMAVTKGSWSASFWRISKKQSQFGLKSATRLHEVGIASNRESACRGEYVLGVCTHRPSNHESWQYPKPVA